MPTQHHHHECSFLLLTPFSSSKNESDRNFTKAAASYAASALLAMIDLQSRKGPLLEERLQGCPRLLFSDLQLLDTQDEDMVGLKALLQALKDHDQKAAPGEEICGLVGPFDGKGMEKTLGVSEFRGLTQVFVTGSDVDDYAGKDGKTAVANFLASKDYWKALARYIKDVLKVKHMAYISAKSKKDRLNHDNFREAMEEQGVAHYAVYFEEEKHENLEGVREDLRVLKRGGIRTIFLSADYREPRSLVKIATVMEDLGMLDGDYQYVLYEDSIRPDDIGFLFGHELEKPDAPLRKLIHGAGWMSEVDPFAMDAEDSTFVSDWRNVDMGALNWPKRATPVDRWAPNEMPTRHSSFVYDSIIAMGLAKCQEIQQQPQQSASEEKDQEGSRQLLKKKEEKQKKPPATEHIQQILEMEPFQGASGTVAFETNDKEERYRLFDGITVAMFNFRTTKYSSVVETPISYVLPAGSQEWQGTGAGFVFANDQTERSYPEFVVAEENYLGDGAFCTGMALFAIGLVSGLGFLAAVTYLEKEGPIRMAQPRFLQLICLGSLMETFSVFTLSFDEGRGWDQESLNAACMATAWLFFLGHATIYSATFCKLWRIDLVLQAAKRRVTYLQAMWPCFVVLLVTVLVLIIWTAHDPWLWERDFVRLVPPETLGKCTSDNFAAYFWTLTAILMFCNLCTLIMAWKTQTIAQNLSDASTVFYLILTQLQAWFVGIPILAVIGDNSVDTVYFGRILLIWLFAMAPLFIVLLPRVSAAIRTKRNPALRQNRGNVIVCGLAQSSTGSKYHASSVLRASGVGPASKPFCASEMRASGAGMTSKPSHASEASLLDGDTKPSPSEPCTGGAKGQAQDPEPPEPTPVPPQSFASFAEESSVE